MELNMSQTSTSFLSRHTWYTNQRQDRVYHSSYCVSRSRVKKHVVSVTQLREKPTGSKQTQPSSTHMTSTNIKQRGSLDSSSNELYIVYYIYIYISVFVIHNYTHHIITYYWIPYPTLLHDDLTIGYPTLPYYMMTLWGCFSTVHQTL